MNKYLNGYTMLKYLLLFIASNIPADQQKHRRLDAMVDDYQIVKN